MAEIRRAHAEVKLLLHNGPGFISSMIRWQTRGKYSHGSILFEDGMVFESREFRGVQKMPVQALKDAMIRNPKIAIDVYRIDFEVSEFLARRFCEEQLGKKYDYCQVVRFITRQGEGRSSGDDWFCSELQVAACRAGKLELFKMMEPYEVSPGLICRSLALTYEGSLIPKKP